MATIEIVQFRLRAGVAINEFVDANSRVERDHVAHQAGFRTGSRVSTIAEDGTWTIRIGWDSTADADASMASFMSASATADFVAMIDQDTMSMRREVDVPSPLSRKVDHVHRLYLEGIRDGDARRAVEEYTGDRYTQHSTGVRDGVEGFVEFFEPFIERNPKRDISLVRTLADGRLVFVHAAQNLNDGEARWVTADLFDTDGNDRIVEHWDVIAALGGTNPSGRSQIDGATEITDLHLTEANKAKVRRLLTEALSKEPTADLGEFISAETYTQHNPVAPDGLEALVGMIAAGRESGEPLHYKHVHRIIGQGNFVASLSHLVLAGSGYAAFDIFRLDDGLIVEHWDVIEPLPSGDNLVNSGKF